MTVRDAINLLSYGCQYRCVGAKTGKKLFDNYNTDKAKEKYMDMKVTDNPFDTELRISKDCLGSGEWCKPIIRIWIREE